MLRRFLYNLTIAFDAIAHNKLRAFLTSLGIVFGVASVIAMLAIGSGAERVILEQMKLLGTNNIVISPKLEKKQMDMSQDNSEQSEKKEFSPGLTLRDAAAIKKIIPNVAYISNEIVNDALIISHGQKQNGRLVGVDRSFLKTVSLDIVQGRFFQNDHFENAVPVCIIGHDVKTRFFPGMNPIGKQLKCGRMWLTVIGVLGALDSDTESLQKYGLRNSNLEIYAPLKTVLLRFENRALLTKQDLRAAEQEDESSNGSDSNENYHQIDRMVVNITETRYMDAVASVLHKMLLRRHLEVEDFKITIPRQLIKQEQQTRRIFNLVLGAIASISLIVGGIGVMNIMLASVLDRFREIGLRQSLGATKRDIVTQFLNEAVAITLSGGLMGIALGYVFSLIISRTTEIATNISPQSVLISFFVSASVGLVFGIYPARKAAEQDPVALLRYE